MAAYFPADRSLRSRIFNRLEKSFAKVFFHRSFLSGDESGKAEEMGVVLNAFDKMVFVGLSLFVFARLGLYAVAVRTPGIRSVADRILVAKLKRQLAGYGHAEFTTDASKYKEARAA